jgi:hypothetical protein
MQRLNLILTLTSADRGNRTDDMRKDRIATCVRRNAGHIESFLISIEESKLKALSINPPGTPSRLLLGGMSSLLGGVLEVRVYHSPTTAGRVLLFKACWMSLDFTYPHNQNALLQG